MRVAIALVVLVFSATGCSKAAECFAKEDCDGAAACVNGICEAPAPAPDAGDAGLGDLGDLGATDLGEPPDLGLHDAGDLCAVPDSGFDVACGTTLRVSVRTGGLESSGRVGTTPVISANGRFIAFTSSASDLVPNDTNDASDVFLHDLLGSATERVSVSTAGAQGNLGSGKVAPERPAFLSISSDGRYVLFGSNATNLLDGQVSNMSRIYMCDRKLSSTEIVDVNDRGEQPEGPAGRGAISGDGLKAVFLSRSDIFVAGDTRNPDIFFRDRPSSTTTRLTDDSQSNIFLEDFSRDGNFVLISRPRGGGATVLDVRGGSFDFLRTNTPDSLTAMSMSCDARFFTTMTTAKLVAEDPNSGINAYLFDRVSNTTVPMDLDSAGMFTDAGGVDATGVSADGALAVFSSSARIDPLDTNDTRDIYVFDRASGKSRVVSLGTDGMAAGRSDSPAISADGRFVTFHSIATNLVLGDSNRSPGIFVTRVCP